MNRLKRIWSGIVDAWEASPIMVILILLLLLAIASLFLE